MSDLLLGIIAGSVLVMAVIQVAAVVVAARAAKRLGALADRLEHDIRPIMASLQTITAEAARTTAMAAATVERADRLFADVAHRVEQTLGAVPGLIAAARNSFNLVNALQGVLAAFHEFRSPGPRRPASLEEEDALFIG